MMPLQPLQCDRCSRQVVTTYGTVDQFVQPNGQPCGGTFRLIAGTRWSHLRQQTSSNDLLERCADHPEATHHLICSVCSTGDDEPSVRTESSHGRIEAYAVEPDVSGDGDWHRLTFTDGWQIQIYTDRPLVVVESEKH